MTVERRRRVLQGLAAGGSALIGAAVSQASGAASSEGTAETAAEDRRGAIEACIRVVYQASMLADAGEAEAMIALYTPDLEMVAPGTYPKVAFRGRDALKAGLQARPAGSVSRHLCTNATATFIDQDTVAVHSYFTHFRGQLPTGSELPLEIQGALRSVGEYQDTLKRINGQWLIAKRIGKFIFGGV